ncbi:NAD(P)H-dependent oxidoreductase subunit E [Castellaniella sp.]|uniref:NAD(P)H-dependent oxidoreductase subunit E n=1 Tax=Castellaniella sp. TaxID=1955812 RepID=UPI002AFF5953|nr:NAD(P)H-dependent oxidoreductase subunit E [Castellaniella sp.]
MDSVRTDPAPQDHSPLIQDILTRHAGQPGSLLPILHAVQDTLGHIPEDAVGMIAAGIQRSRAEVHGVIHFYTHFRTTPPARTQVEVCRAESCQACGSEALYRHAEQRAAGQPAGQMSLAPVYCLGLCAQSPAVMINGQPHARVTPEKLDALLES